MTEEQISEFETLSGQLESFHLEIGTLVKKSPNDSLNKFKLTLVNTTIGRTNLLLGSNRKPFQEFDQFDADAVPSNSDVLVVIGQYRSALEKLRSDNIKQSLGVWYWWRTDAEGRNGDLSNIRTAPPKRITDK